MLNTSVLPHIFTHTTHHACQSKYQFSHLFRGAHVCSLKLHLIIGLAVSTGVYFADVSQIDFSIKPDPLIDQRSQDEWNVTYRYINKNKTWKSVHATKQWLLDIYAILRHGGVYKSNSGWETCILFDIEFPRSQVQSCHYIPSPVTISTNKQIAVDIFHVYCNN